MSTQQQLLPPSKEPSPMAAGQNVVHSATHVLAPRESQVSVGVERRDSGIHAAVSVSEGNFLRRIGDALGDWIKRRYTEAAALARLKVLSLAALLAMYGAGITASITFGSNGSTVSFILASPGIPEIIGGGLALVFVVAMDVYGASRRRADEREFWEIAANPETPETVRTSLLARLKRM